MNIKLLITHSAICLFMFSPIAKAQQPQPPQTCINACYDFCSALTANTVEQKIKNLEQYLRPQSQWMNKLAHIEADLADLLDESSPFCDSTSTGENNNCSNVCSATMAKTQKVAPKKPRPSEK